jgi:PAS domain S-box-containing protein
VTWSWTPYAAALFGAAASCLAVAVVGVRRRARGVVAFTALLLSVAVWTAAYGLEMLSVPLPQKLFWARVQYVGIVLVPVAWLVFALQYAGRVRRMPFLPLAAMLAVPLTTLTLLWNPQASGLIWQSAGLVEGPGLQLLRLGRGPWFWVHTVYSYALWIAAAVIFMLALRRSPHLYRKQRLPLILAVFAPFALNVAYVVGASAVDLTPFGFFVTGLATLWALTRQHFLDIMPVARAQVLEGMHDGVIVLDPENRIIDLNPAAAAIVGRPASAIVGDSFDAAFSGRIELRELGRANDQRQLEAVLDGVGEARSFELRSWPLEQDEGPIGRLLVFRDITREKRAEAAAHASEEQLRVVVEQMPAVLWTTDAELRISRILGAGLQQLRIAPAAIEGIDLFEMFGTIDRTHPAVAAHLHALEGAPTTYAVEWFGRDFECHVEPLDDGLASAFGVIGVGVDVTERRDLREQLRQSQKMEAIGRMAGGVAHDFNNLLTAVAGYAQLAHEDLENIDGNPAATAKLRHDLEAIGHAAERATSITAQLLAFSRRQVLQPRTLILNDTLEEMDAMLRRMIGAQIELVNRFAPDCAAVRIDPGQLQQVVINLVLNARDAMPGGGTVTFETDNVELTEGVNVPYDVIPPGSYVLLTVTDDGVGMDERTRARLFEPFFTTKEAGKGTGLGLSTVYGIIRQTGGYITVDSRPGKGARFKIWFPAVERGAALDEVAGGLEPAPQLRGDETVLLVEDEAMVRELASRVLNGHGYLVLEAASGPEALEACRRHEGPVDLLVTDVVMPGMNGSELAERVATLYPEAHVLFISGYTGGALVEHGVLRDGTHFLQKPFSPDHFMSKVREVLDLTS